MAGPSSAPSHPRGRRREGGHTWAVGSEAVRAPQYLVVKDRYYKPFTPGGSAGVDAPAQSPECILSDSRIASGQAGVNGLLSLCCRFAVGLTALLGGLLEVKCLFSE